MVKHAKEGNHRVYPVGKPKDGVLCVRDRLHGSPRALRVSPLQGKEGLLYRELNPPNDFLGATDQRDRREVRANLSNRPQACHLRKNQAVSKAHWGQEDADTLAGMARDLLSRMT